MKRNKSSAAVRLAVLLLVVSVALIAVFGLAEQYLSRIDTAVSPSEAYFWSDSADGRIYVGGKWYIPKKNIETVLMLGIDSMLGSGEARQNAQQADFLALLVVDRSAESYRILHLNRDTVTDIPQLDMYGNEYGSYKAQLTLAHTYGSTDKQRCRNTVSAVEHMLYGIHIDHYLSLTMDAVALLNDSIGGVTLRLLDDFTMLDESFVKDAVVTLKGEQALQYIRERGALQNSTNLRRMERQQQYIHALLEQYSSFGTKNPLDTSAMKKLNSYAVSDFSIDQLSRFLEKIFSYTCDGIETVKGETAVGADGYTEFYADEAALQKQVTELFYEIRN